MALVHGSTGVPGRVMPAGHLPKLLLVAALVSLAVVRLHAATLPAIPGDSTRGARLFESEASTMWKP